MAVVIILPAALMDQRERLSVPVALESSLALMVKLVQASRRPINIAQPPPAGPMKRSREPKNAC